MFDGNGKGKSRDEKKGRLKGRMLRKGLNRTRKG